MKKLLIGICGLLIAVSGYANVSFDIQAGDLKNSDGTTAAPTGGLLLLVAAGADDKISNDLSAGQFVSSDDIILGAFAINSNDPSGGAFTRNSGTFTGVTGEALALRWFPDVTFALYEAGQATTSIGTAFGTFAGATTGSGPNGGDLWVIPADSFSLSLNFITASLNTRYFSDALNDAIPNSAGTASLRVIPEPSSFALIGLGLAGLVAARKRRS